MILQKPTIAEKIAYGFGALGKDSVYMLVSAFYMVYLYRIQGLPLSFISLLFFSVRIFDSLNDPLIGYMVDRFRSEIFGKFKLWLLTGALLSTFFLILMFHNPHSYDLEELKIYAILTYLGFTISYTIHDIPFWSIIPTFGSDSRTRETMTTIARIGSLLGDRIILLIGLPVLYYFSVNLKFHDQSFMIFAIILGILMLLSTAAVILRVQDRTPNRQKVMKVKEAWQVLRYNDQLLVVFSLSLLQQVVIGLVNATLTFFLLYINNSYSLMSVFMIPGGFAMLIAFISFPKATNATSRRSVFVASCVMMALGYSMMFIFNISNIVTLTTVTIAYCVASFGMGWSLSSTTVMTADCVDYGEFRMGCRTEGLTFSVQTLSTKLGTSIALMLSGMSMSVASYLHQIIPIANQLNSLRVSLLIVVVLMILMLCLYLKLYKLHGKFFENILNSLIEFRRESFNGKTNTQKYPVSFALDTRTVIYDVNAATVDEVLNIMIDRLYQVKAINVRSGFLSAIKNIMAESPAGIADGIALPHGRGKFVNRMALAVATLRTPLDFAAPDGRKCDLVFMMATPDDGQSHLNLLGKLSLILNEPGFPDKLRASGSPEEIAKRLIKCEKHLKNNY